MICSSCGREIPDESVFCEYCGQKIAGDAQPANVGEAPVNAATKKKSKAPLIAVLCVGAVFVAAAALFLTRSIWMTSGGNSSESVVVLRESSFDFIKNAKNTDIGSVSFSDEGTYDNVGVLGFDADGEYFFFYRDVNSNDYSGDLCRVKLSDISDDYERTMNAVQEIDTKVDLAAASIISADKVVYMRKDDVYVFEGGESYELLNDVNYFEVIDGTYLVYSSDTDKQEIGIVAIEKDAEPAQIDDGADLMMAKSDFIAYTKSSSGEDASDLYVAANDGSSELVGEGVYTYYFDYDNDAIWYLKDSGNGVKITDIITDQYKENDAAYTEAPELKHGLREVKETTAMSDWKEYHKSYYGNKESFYSEAKEYCESWDDDYYSYYNYDDDQVYYVDPETRQWYWYDEDYYEEYEDAYYAAYARNSLREEFAQKEDMIPRYELYYYSGGKSELISENVGHFTGDASIGFFVTVRDDPEPVCDLGEIADGTYSEDLDISDEKIADAVISGCSYSISGGAPQSYSDDYNDEYAGVFVSGNYAVLIGIDGDLGEEYYKCSIDGDKLVNEEKFPDNDAIAVGWGDRGFYYSTGTDSDGTGDLYCWDGKSDTLVAKDIYVWNFIECDDGILGKDAYENGDLYLYTDSDRIRIGEDVSVITDVIYVDSKLVLYKDDGHDLFATDMTGENDHRIASDIEYFYAPVNNGSYMFSYENIY